jgi:plasmid stabilization system protein ParE
MVKEIRWTKEARDTFENVVRYLDQNWTEKEITAFIRSSNKVIDFITEYPNMFRKTTKPNVREALITSQNLLIYKIYSKQIDLLVFWDTRKNPRKKLARRK